MTKQHKKADVELLNDLSEFISVRMKSFREQSHDGNWFEHKSHGDYDLWFIQAGTVRLNITASPLRSSNSKAHAANIIVHRRYKRTSSSWLK